MLHVFVAANFSIPQEEIEEGETPIYADTIFVELNKEEALKQVEEYNKVRTS